MQNYPQDLVEANSTWTHFRQKLITYADLNDIFEASPITLTCLRKPLVLEMLSGSLHQNHLQAVILF
jgi:hypothetical protein